MNKGWQASVSGQIYGSLRADALGGPAEPFFSHGTTALVL